MAESTRRSYSVAWTRYQRCCKAEGVSPLSVSEQGLCRFVTALAVEGLDSTSIRSSGPQTLNSAVCSASFLPGENPTTPPPKRIPDPCPTASTPARTPVLLQMCKIHTCNTHGMNEHKSLGVLTVFQKNDLHGLLRASPVPASLPILRGLLGPS